LIAKTKTKKHVPFGQKFRQLLYVFPSTPQEAAQMTDTEKTMSQQQVEIDRDEYDDDEYDDGAAPQAPVNTVPAKMATINPKDIKTDETFSSLFPVNPGLLTQIESSVREQGFDACHPVIFATCTGQKDPVCIDGHTRIQAAKNVGIEAVPFVVKEKFETEQEALEHAIKLQSNRRNLTDGDILSCVALLHKPMARGGDRRSKQAKSKPQSCGIENARSSSAEHTAKLLNIGARKVEQALNVINRGTPEIEEAVLKNETSINQACEEIKARRKEQSADNEAEEPDVSSDTNSEPPPDAPKAQTKVSKSDAASADKKTLSTVTLAREQYRALRELGGSIEDHVAQAIDMYLLSLSNPDAGEDTCADVCDDEDEYDDGEEDS
jgi:hypothetical protein